ncbi:MAG: FtsW/RodA/SpoVE family cell cycle protein [Bacilli bacterium]|nr:FtsW/RodA/SpoVE family cell cycle protein [Bacilli bacterium]
MKNIKLIICIIIFALISIVTIYSSTFILSNNYKYLYIKQGLWYLFGFLLIFIIWKCKKGFFYKYDKILYFIFNSLLVLVLFFGTKSNGSSAWFEIPGIGSFQPSEFMKIILIIVLANELDKYKNIDKTFKNELIVILKCLIITILPAILTFLEPDTGNVIIYFVILIVMLFVYGIRYRWFIISLTIIIITIGSFLYLYFYKSDIFINIFGTDFFYRMDRILEWKNKEGMQLENALASIGSSPLTGYGLGKTPIYIPEAQTDFIVSIFLSNFGYITGVTFILFLVYFDIILIRIALFQKLKDKYTISGIISILLFQQIQNIGMNIGLLPITGITLPFISYGGSSLISYMILIGIIININKKTLKK